MVNQQILEGNWDEMQAKLRRRWGQLTDEDLPRFHGVVEKLVGTIQRKTGEGREAIENYLNELSASCDSNVGNVAENLRPYARRAAESLHNTTKQATDQIRAGYRDAERYVRDRPRESLALCFGAGLVAGLLVAMMINSK